MEGKQIAVWVYSNLDKVELFLNGKSLGMKEMKKDSHLAWNVEYAAGTIEAKGYKGDKQVMSTKRETTGSAAKLVMTADRKEISADGVDVAMFAVEVQDAQGRVVPVTDNQVTFKVTGAGRLMGTGNGDPTNQEPDTGDSRKAFSGLCMAVVQATKDAGNITVEATAPGLTSASTTVTAKAVKLQPQVAVWEREVPKGPGITGLWRPVPTDNANPMMAFLTGGDSTLYSLRQDGSKLSGSVEGGDISFFGGSDAPLPLTDGTVDGGKISFTAGSSTYTGTVNGERLELKRVIKLPFEWNRRPEAAAGSASRDWTAAGWLGSIDRFIMGDAAGHPGCSAAGSEVRGRLKTVDGGMDRMPPFQCYSAGS